MSHTRRQSPLIWAEDTALFRAAPANGATARSTRSADPGVGVERRTGDRSGSVFLPFNFNIQASNLRGTTPRLFDRMSLPQLANADQSEFQFTLNQDTFFATHCPASVYSTERK